MVAEQHPDAELSVAPLNAARPAPAGSTFGVEEEFHLVDPGSYRLTRSPSLATAVLRGEAGPHLHAEITTTQLEAVTGICTDLPQLRAELVTTRAEAAGAAARAGVRILAASTHPFDSWEQQDITPAPRYQAMVDRWASLALQQDICGCHVHVGVPDLDTAVAVMDRSRPYLPTLLAMTSSSPFHDGVDTSHASYRTVWWSRWPTSGPPEYLGSAERFREVVHGLVVSGVIADSSHLYWDLRPSSHLPTLEFRLADVCTEVDDVVLHAALVRSLVRVLAARAEREEPGPRPRSELLRAARWRAALHGLDGQLFDVVRCELVPARVAVRRLLSELRNDLEDHDEWTSVVEMVERLFERGTSASRQRRTWLRTGDWREVAARIVREGTALENR
jgi:YbdK family carboxylate-amine ligase